MTLAETLSRADQIHDDAWEAIEGRITIVDDRSHLLLGYGSLALEHQHAIVLLLRNNLIGSAFALVRPVFEILYRAHWVAVCATPDDVDKIRKNTFRFPNVARMTADIDAAVDSAAFGRVRTATWADQNDFTHSGMFQVRSRFSQRDLQPEYPVDITIAQVNRTMIAALIVAALALRYHGRHADAQRIDALTKTLDTAPGA